MAKTGKTTSKTSANPQRLRQLRRQLLGWFARASRELPWRKATDAYAIWVSEAMLQQTQVETVKPYFERWMQQFPNLRILAEASEADVLRAWQGLGYYSRARNLRKAAICVVRDHGGQLPRTPADLRLLPGIGPYTAGAIASIAFGERAALVDGNVNRVLSRIFAVEGYVGTPRHDRKVWRLAEELVPETRPGDFNQALMELGALICKPVSPKCPACPLQAGCHSNSAERASRWGRKPPRKKATLVNMAAAIISHRGRVLVVQQPKDAARWAGMWQFPCVELEASEGVESGARRAARAWVDLEVTARRPLPPVVHSVTRYRITLTPVECRTRRVKLRPKGRTAACWLSAEQLEDRAMPAAHARIRSRLLAC